MEFNPFSPSFAANPHPYYKDLRDEQPVSWCGILHGWMITRYDDVVTVLQDHKRFSSDDRHARQATIRRRENPPGRNMLSSDPPVHTRLRRIISRYFTPKMIVSWESRIRNLVGETLDEGFRKNETFDVMSD